VRGRREADRVDGTLDSIPSRYASHRDALHAGIKDLSPPLLKLALPLLLLPALRGEKVGMRGFSQRIRLAENPPHPALRADLSPQAAIVCTQVDREGRHPDLSPSFQDEPSVGASRLKAQARNPSGSKRDEGWVPGSRFQRAVARRTRAPERQQRGCVNRIAASGERYLRAPTTHTGPAASPRSLDRHRRPRRAC